MGFTIVQTTFGTVGSGNTVTATFATTPTAGNMLIAFVSYSTGGTNNAAADYTFSDTAANSWNQPSATGAYLADNPGGGRTGGGENMVAWVGACKTHASNVVTLTQSGGTTSVGITLVIAEVSGVSKINNPARVVVTNYQSVGATTTPTASIANGINDLVIGWITGDNGQTAAASGFSLLSNAGSGGSVAQYETAATTPTSVTGAAQDDGWDVIAISFVPETVLFIESDERGVHKPTNRNGALRASVDAHSLLQGVSVFHAASFGFGNDEAKPAHKAPKYPAAYLNAMHEMSAFSKTKPLGNTAILQDDEPPQKAPPYRRASIELVHEWSAYDQTKPLGNTAILQDHSERSQPRAWRGALSQAPNEWAAFDKALSILLPLAPLQDDTDAKRNGWTGRPRALIEYSGGGGGGVSLATSETGFLDELQPPPQRPTRARIEPQTEAVLKGTVAVVLGPIAPLQDDAVRQQPRAFRLASMQVPHEATGFDATKPLGNTPIFQDDSTRQQAPRYPWPDRHAAFESHAELPDAHPLATPVPLQDDSVRQRAPQYLMAARGATNDAQAELPDAHPLGNTPIFQDDSLPQRAPRYVWPERLATIDAVAELHDTKPLGNTAIFQDDSLPQRAAPVPRGRPLTTVQPEQVFDVLNLVVLPSMGGWSVDDARGRWKRIRDTEEIATLADTKPLPTPIYLQEDPAPRKRCAPVPEEVQAYDRALTAGLGSIVWEVDDARPRVAPRAPAEELASLSAHPQAPVWALDEPRRVQARRIDRPGDELPIPLRSTALPSVLFQEEPLGPPPRARRAPGIDDAPHKDVHVVVLTSLGWSGDPDIPRRYVRPLIVDTDLVFAIVRAVRVISTQTATVESTYSTAVAAANFTTPTVNV